MPIVQINPEVMIDKPWPMVDLLKGAGFEVRYPKNPLLSRGTGTEEELIDELQGVSAVIATVAHYSEKVISSLPQLRVIARAGVGYDQVDVTAASKHRVAVTVTPTANHEAVAELALSLLFGLTKRLISNHQTVREGGWHRVPVLPLRKRTMGILGLGRIGRSMAIRCQALGMNVIATESFPHEEFVRRHEIRLVDFETLLSESDFISIHCPLNEETTHLFNKEAFAKMKPSSMLFNTARGPIIHEADLVEALKAGEIAAAGLDVFEVEPTHADNPLFKLDNVLFCPHLGGIDESSIVDMGTEAADCIAKLYQGQWPAGAVVNEELRENWKW